MQAEELHEGCTVRMLQGSPELCSCFASSFIFLSPNFIEFQQIPGK